MLSYYHIHTPPPSSPNSQCKSTLVQTIHAPLPLVWSVVRQFDKPQLYKKFVRSCSLICGDSGVGSIREINVVSGLPAQTSIERLDTIDDELHVMSFSIIDGDHRLRNYHSTIIVRAADEVGKTVVTESYTVDKPSGTSVEDTCLFIDTIIKLNLKSLAYVTEKMFRST
uniref:PYL1 n=1 Tax=Epimedium pseudowushanense TaxID=589473 RepID=A0A7R6BMF0_9MAGN|nr:PYL1 [Epimedium pseudowushanense]